MFPTLRRILWRLGVLLPAAPNFTLWKTSVDSAALEKIVDSGLRPWAFNYDQLRFA